MFTGSTETGYARPTGRPLMLAFAYPALGSLLVLLALHGSAFSASVNNALWVANGTNVLEFGPGQLKGIRNTKPETTLNSSAFKATQGVVFDTAGDLWVIDGGAITATPPVAPALDMFTPAQLKALHKKKSNSPTPTVQITSPVLVFPQQAVFDSAGNLWVSDNANGGPGSAVYVFAANQLTTTGSVTPSVTLLSNPAFNGALGIVFGPNGNLWIANNGGTNLFEFDKAHLPALGSGSSTLIPDVILSDNGANSIQGPWALIFDSAGNLWSSNANTPFTIVEFGKADLGTTGEPTPAITISPATFGKKSSFTSLNAPNGISFNNKGNLGVANSAGTPLSLALFTAKQINATGSPTPSGFIGGSKTGLSAPAGDNFGPFTK
jgi:hypothetical protein